MKSIGNTVLFLLLSFSLISCASTKEKPQLNPNPKYFLTIKGYISPELKDKIFLSFVQTYSGTLKQCEHVSNPLAGLPEEPGKSDTYNTIPNDKGFYQVKIPLDKYLFGYCGWVPWALGYDINNQNPDGFLLVNYANFTKKNNPKFVSLNYGNDRKQHPFKLSKNSLLPVEIKGNEPYDFDFNIIT